MGSVLHLEGRSQVYIANTELISNCTSQDRNLRNGSLRGPPQQLLESDAETHSQALGGDPGGLEVWGLMTEGPGGDRDATGRPTESTNLDPWGLCGDESFSQGLDVCSDGQFNLPVRPLVI